jgi:hypothetical protein
VAFHDQFYEFHAISTFGSGERTVLHHLRGPRLITAYDERDLGREQSEARASSPAESPQARVSGGDQTPDRSIHLWSSRHTKKSGTTAAMEMSTHTVICSVSWTAATLTSVLVALAI